MNERTSTEHVDECIVHAQGLVGALADGLYDEVMRMAPHTRLSKEEIRSAITSYGRKLVRPPSDWPDRWLDVVEVRGASSATSSVVVPLWTEEEGKSDLSLEVTIVNTDGKWTIGIDDIHVR